MTDFPARTPQHASQLQPFNLPEPDDHPTKLSTRDFGPEIPDEKPGPQLPPRWCHAERSPPEAPSVGRGLPSRPELVESLSTLLSPEFDLPQLEGVNGILIDHQVSTSLVPEETAVTAPPQSVLSWSPDVREVLEKTFRHGFWERRRRATYDALNDLKTDQETIRRFRDCGLKTWVMQDPQDHSRYRLKTNKCKNRWCEACSVEKRRTVRRNLVDQLPDGDLKFLTFTLKSNTNPLGDEITRLYDAFKKWRKHPWFKRKIRGGITFLEVTFNHTSNLWHPHLHCLVDSAFLPQAEMRQIWLNITGDSFIVDIRKIRDTENAAGEVAKYATKSITSKVWRHPERLQEAITALQGRRTFQSFGTWSKLSLSRLPEDDTEWECVGSLAWFIQRAQRGETPAMQVLDSIIGNRSHEPIPNTRAPPVHEPNPCDRDSQVTQLTYQ